MSAAGWHRRVPGARAKARKVRLDLTGVGDHERLMRDEKSPIVSTRCALHHDARKTVEIALLRSRAVGETVRFQPKLCTTPPVSERFASRRGIVMTL
jgi:hypothetical protein